MELAGLCVCVHLCVCHIEQLLVKSDVLRSLVCLFFKEKNEVFNTLCVICVVDTYKTHKYCKTEDVMLVGLNNCFIFLWQLYCMEI